MFLAMDLTWLNLRSLRSDMEEIVLVEAEGEMRVRGTFVADILSDGI